MSGAKGHKESDAAPKPTLLHNILTFYFMIVNRTVMKSKRHLLLQENKYTNR